MDNEKIISIIKTKKEEAEEQIKSIVSDYISVLNDFGITGVVINIDVNTNDVIYEDFTTTRLLKGIEIRTHF